MVTQITLDFTIDRCPPEILDMQTYNTFLIEEIRGSLLGNQQSSEFFHNSRMVMENWWSGNLTSEACTYGLHEAIKDAYKFILGTKITGTAHLYNTKETTGLQDTEIAIVEKNPLEDQLDYKKFLINFWRLLSKHREYRFHLLFRLLSNYYIVALMANETYQEQISKSDFKQQWTEIEYIEKVPKSDMLVYELDRDGNVTFTPDIAQTGVSIGD